MCKSTDNVIGVCHKGVWGSGGTINMLLVLALYGGNYFVLCKRCSTALSVKQPLTSIAWEAVQTLKQMWILWKGEKSLEIYYPVSPIYRLFTI
jgi:hypothetical protein